MHTQDATCLKICQRHALELCTSKNKAKFNYDIGHYKTQGDTVYISVVDKDGNVFHLGKEQPKLKGTLPPTKVKPKKKTTKRRTKEQILLARAAEKKVALKKAVKKQKDFLNHKFGG